jgi:hypothetical protein
MWASVVTGKTLHARARKEKHENIIDRVPGRAGYNRFGTNRSPDRAAKAGQSNADTATRRSASSGSGGGSASVWPRPKSAPDVESVGAGPIWNVGGKHGIRSKHPGEVERH